PAANPAHRAMLHWLDVRGKPLGTHDVLTQQFTHLGGGSAVMDLEPAAASTVFPVRLTMPRSPTHTPSVLPKRVLSVSTGAGTVSGSDVLPSNTCTAKGSPVPVVTKPITIWVFLALLSRLFPKAGREWNAPSKYEEVTS